MKRKKKINYRISKKYRNMKEVIEKRYLFLVFFIIFSFLILTISLFNVQIVNHKYNVEKVAALKVKTVSGPSAPRGRIYDRNQRLIVDNKPVKIITYKRASGVNTKEEIELAYEASKYLELDYSKLSEYNLKKFWITNNRSEANAKITAEEWQLLKERRITDSDIDKLKLERITEKELNEYKEADKKAAHLYYLMNNGYYFMDKLIKDKNVTDIEYAVLSENSDVLKGFKATLDWERVYPYGDTFKTILGSVSTTKSGIPLDLKDYYLSKGYRLDDRVGISYLEYQFEDILRGEKNVYEVINGKQVLIEEGKRGNDIVLTIDIELQKEVEKIITEELIAAKNEKNTEFLKNAFVIVSDPNTGEILAMAGKELYEKEEVIDTYDFTPGIVINPVVAGSVVKGASNIVAYNNGALNIGEKRDDACIKIMSTPIKCSWKYLGVVNDISALKVSSNTFQFHSAMKLGGATYKPNAPLNINKEAFSIYRDGFSEFGLGVKTGIDLPVESLGYKGINMQAGHLLDFSIGQYDTYTPIQLSQYINTIANGGYRLKPQLLKTVYKPNEENLNEVVLNIKPEVQNIIKTDPIYLERVKEGFRGTLTSGGTGVGYIYGGLGAGKTGTSESFIDTTNDGRVDTLTYSNNFVGYAPFDDPKVSFTIVTPNVSHSENNLSYRTRLNYRISNQVSKKFFEIYE